MDPLFLVELGDVYARLGRYDLMLRYMYSQDALPARMAMARPITELARIAESVRLARPDASSHELTEEVLPETVSQVLFDQPVLRGHRLAEHAAPGAMTRPRVVGWVLLSSGSVVLLGAFAWLIRRGYRRDAGL
jgi:hypothetical protein